MNGFQQEGFGPMDMTVDEKVLHSGRRVYPGLPWPTLAYPGLPGPENAHRYPVSVYPGLSCTRFPSMPMDQILELPAGIVELPTWSLNPGGWAGVPGVSPATFEARLEAPLAPFF
jgi:hypothetical protein